jgi:5-methylcytosine-specific restriction endonuclease McrA
MAWLNRFHAGVGYNWPSLSQHSERTLLHVSRIDLIQRVARSDATFQLVDGDWIGRCLICNGPLRFDARTGGGVTVEHIVPRSMGGSNDLLNLGLAHLRCNTEKGRRWDAPKRRRGRSQEYEYLLMMLLTKRRARWRDPETAPAQS